MFQKLKDHLKELKTTMEPLPFWQKVEHLWIYYKAVLFIAIAIGIAISLVVNAVVSARQVTLLNGTALNVFITDEGHEKIKQVISEDGTLEGRSFLDEFPYLDTFFLEMGALDEQTANYLVTRISALNLDYILADDSVMDVLSANYFMDMRQLFDEQTLSGWKLVYKVDEDSGESIPVAIELPETAFTSEHLIAGKGKLYMCCTAGNIHPEAFVRLAEFLIHN